MSCQLSTTRNLKDQKTAHYEVQVRVWLEVSQHCSVRSWKWKNKAAACRHWAKLFGTEKAKQPHFPVFCDQRKHFSLIYRWQSNNSLMMSFIFSSVIPRGIPMAVCQINWSGSFLCSHHMMSQMPPFLSSSSSIPPPQQTTDAQSLNIYKGPLCWAVRQILDFNKHWRKFGPWTIDVISMWWRSFKIKNIYFWWYIWTTLFLFQNCSKLK